MQKFIFITGAQDDVLSRSFVSSATASLLAARGFSIKLKKLSPLMNVNFALSDPAECGEIFLTADGTETDGELGRMERFSQVAADSLSFITMGELLRSVLNKESFGSYLGKPVKTEPHLTDEILSFVTKTLGKQPDIILCAVGGREDDIEALPYFKAIKIAKESFCEGSVLHIHVQNAKNKLVKNPLLSPDVIVSVKSHFENNGENEEETVSACDKVFDACMENPYLLPVELEKKGFAAEIIKKLGLQDFKPNIVPWRQFAEKAESSQKEVKIAICGKYLPNTSAYLSLTDGLISGGVARGIKVVPEFVAADDVTDETAKELFANAKGIVIADGRAERGIQGLASPDR